MAHEHDIDIEGACGGECACSTCHVLLEQDICAEEIFRSLREGGGSVAQHDGTGFLSGNGIEKNS